MMSSIKPKDAKKHSVFRNFWGSELIKPFSFSDLKIELCDCSEIEYDIVRSTGYLELDRASLQANRWGKCPDCFIFFEIRKEMAYALYKLENYLKTNEGTRRIIRCKNYSDLENNDEFFWTNSGLIHWTVEIEKWDVCLSGKISVCKCSNEA